MKARQLEKINKRLHRDKQAGIIKIRRAVLSKPCKVEKSHKRLTTQKFLASIVIALPKRFNMGDVSCPFWMLVIAY